MEGRHRPATPAGGEPSSQSRCLGDGAVGWRCRRPALESPWPTGPGFVPLSRGVSAVAPAGVRRVAAVCAPGRAWSPPAALAADARSVTTGTCPGAERFEWKLKPRVGQRTPPPPQRHWSFKRPPGTFKAPAGT